MNCKEQLSSVATLKPVHKSAIQPQVITEQTRTVDRRTVLLPPSSFLLPSRSKGTLLQPSLPEGMEVRGSNSTHPASTPRTSLDSQKLAEASPSSAASSSSKGSREVQEEKDECLRNEFDSEKDGGREDVGEGVGMDGEQDGDGEGHELEKVQEEAVKYELLGQLRKEESLQRRIAAMKNTLQEFQELKATYR